MQTSKELQITDLSEATALFTNTYSARNPKTTMHFDSSVKAKYETLDKKFYHNNYDVGEEGNPHPLPIRKQMEFPKNHDRPVARIISATIFNALGMEDKYYYYILSRSKGWYRGWAKAFDFKKYLGSDGIYIPMTVIKHIFDNKVLERSSIVIVTGDGDIRIAKSKVIDDFYMKHQKVYINSYAQIMTGFPKELFEKY